MSSTFYSSRFADLHIYFERLTPSKLIYRLKNRVGNETWWRARIGSVSQSVWVAVSISRSIRAGAVELSTGNSGCPVGGSGGDGAGGDENRYRSFIHNGIDRRKPIDDVVSVYHVTLSLLKDSIVASLSKSIFHRLRNNVKKTTNFESKHKHCWFSYLSG